MKEAQLVNPLNRSFRLFFNEATKISLRNPGQAWYFLRAMLLHQKATRRRAAAAREGAANARQGLHVPPIIVISVTDRCNLRCKGCFHQALRRPGQTEMSETELRDALIQARDLGVFFIVLIGGEPLVRPDIMPITKDFPDLIFFVFSNGTLVTEEMARQFRRQKNIVPILSIEGYTTETDGRRGGGVYEKVQEAIRKLRRQNVFFGASVTVTRDNFKAVTKENFVAGLTGFGCKLLLFAEYTPVQPGTDEWVVTNEQRRNLVSILEGFRRKFPAFFVSSPNDEKAFGGCLAAGRGFVHVSACGDVEPCPFVPYSDVSLRKKTLSEALQSPLLRAIREQDNLLGEAEGGCALWMRREWVRSLLVHDDNGKCGKGRRLNGGVII